MQIIYKYIVCILLFTCLGFTQDTLITKQGKQYIGKVIDSDSKSVKFSYPEWDSPKKFYLNSAEVFLEPNPILKAYKNYKNNKKKLKKEKKLYLMEARRNSSFLIKEKAIYDAKHKARKWVMYPTLASTYLGYLLISDPNELDLFEVVLGGVLSVYLPYVTLDALDKKFETQLILHNYNDSEKEIYHSEYKKTFKRKKLLYSAIGIPVAGSFGLILVMVAFASL
jgi:hypothetical protein